MRVGIKNGDNNQPDAVVDHGKKKQEGYRGMAASEDHPRREPGKGDVSGCRDAPPPTKRVAADHLIEDKIDYGGTENAAEGREERVDDLFEGVEVSAGQAALRNFHGGV